MASAKETPPRNQDGGKMTDKLLKDRAQTATLEVLGEGDIVDLILFKDMRDYLIKKQKEGASLKTLPTLGRRWLKFRLPALPTVRSTT